MKYAILAVLFLSGCSVVGQPVAEKVADAVILYCQEPQSQRLVVRELVNAELAGEGHSVRVSCAGDE